MNEIAIKSMSVEQLETLMRNLGEKPFHGAQVYEWLHGKMVNSFDEMTNLSKELREKLKASTAIGSVQLIEKIVSQDESVVKYLFQVENNDVIESVLMKSDYGNTVCVSSQAGCRMGCAFCASTLGGLRRGLSAGEIAEQVYYIQKDMGERVTNIVVMGIGEPFDNYDQVMKALRILNSERGLNLGQRGMTVSTCGVVDGIYSFAEENTQINLAVSLHAPNDRVRRRIMPVARRYGMAKLLKACDDYTAKTNRRVTYEYALMEGLNDAPCHAAELGEKLRGSLCHVNLMPLNYVADKNISQASVKSVKSFANTLQSYGIETTIRRSRGADIGAACGQLRNKHLA